MYNISARRATESDYGNHKDNKPLEFETELEKWASANIEAKKSMIVSWSIIRAEVTLTSKVMEYCGTIRISNPKTLQSWIDRGWYQKVYLKATYLT
jgi:uracil phosphoribosyltransferase